MVVKKLLDTCGGEREGNESIRGVRKLDSGTVECDASYSYATAKDKTAPASHEVVPRVQNREKKTT